ncbi:LOG family protein [Gloeobacter morelensis]|uniref:LOG family protein n=1 Tax=Gloeobacter morelensis MG652769 TaxID=2781736 RepID=A0ABY3PNB3_9CYAN|nr:LOG family protein [Gloeobacter morelensis MG652769]
MVVMDTLRPTALSRELDTLLKRLADHPHGELIARTLQQIVQISNAPERTRLDWKIINNALQDMEQAFRIFAPYANRRKVAIFGSSRTGPGTAIFEHARAFARRVVERGFMVVTGAGGGVMEAGNAGASTEESFGLNISLPFEQGANPHIDGDAKLIHFKYFFTRKLFFVRETDGFALFPGGLGTQDECFEVLTLLQTGKAAMLPLVMVDLPGGDYWQSWDAYLRTQLLGRGLISPADVNLYRITDDIDLACDHICQFYRVYHSSRYVGSQLVIRLQQELSNAFVESLNDHFYDILDQGRIVKSPALAREEKDEAHPLPRLVLHFDRASFGRLRMLIDAINNYEPSRDLHTDPAVRLGGSCGTNL